MAQTILITGAGRGIGLALARQAQAAGDRVTGTLRDPGQATALGTIPWVAMDVTDPDRIAAVAASLPGPLDLLVCNAGVYRGRGGIEDGDCDAAAWTQSMLANVAGPFWCVRAFLPQLTLARGRVAVISSLMGSTGRAPGGAYPYRASKAAATNLARNLGAELRPRGIAVGAYHPGWVRTDMGGGGADIDAEDSARGLLARFARLSLETSGTVEDYLGTPIPH